MDNNERTLTVSQFNEMINLQVSGLGAFEVVGEITEKRITRNSGLMMTIKDEGENAVLKLSGFAPRVRGVNSVDVGMKIIAAGTPQLYSPFGVFSLQVTSLVPHGEGSLKAAYEKLKKLLEDKGFFSETRKRQLPEYITKIALITADGSAAQTDFLKILGETETGLDIEFYPVTVQGKNAPGEIIAALKKVSESASVDCVVLTRGGGSLEDLIAFNDEQVAEAIFASSVPVLSAVGHERDTSISDLVADVVASTPSQAAYYLASINQIYMDGLAEQLFEISGKLKEELTKYEYSSKLKLISQRLKGELKMFDYTDRLALMRKSIGNHYSSISTKIASYEDLLNSYNPYNVLKRGYSLTRLKGNVINTIDGITNGDTIETELIDGKIISRVVTTED
ncbi:exodeoxyribonuclease VII large subunit [Candidatus Dojkabacteria bacterium]|nr:exodeoxyribonuclease VII large subunit [Candidatus Dojkabacteria bacterium]